MVVLSLAAQPALAIDPDQALSQLNHQGWSAKDGGPGSVRCIGQTPDGFLWLGTIAGLYRFDGVTFEHVRDGPNGPLNTDDIRSLIGMPNGDLWGGLGRNGMFRYAQGHFTYFGAEQKLPTAPFVTMRSGRHGDAWASVYNRGVWHSDAAGHWHHFGGETAANDPITWDADVDGDDTLWVQRLDGIYSAKKGTDQLTLAFPPRSKNRGFISVDGHGVAWNSDLEAGLMELSPPNRKFVGQDLGSPDDPGTGVLLFDRDGGLWTVRAPQDLVRVPDLAKTPLAPQTMSPKESLAGPALETVFEDKLGAIWVASSGGVDRFRANRMNKMFSPADHVGNAAISEESDDSLWVASNSGLRLLDKEGHLSEPLVKGQTLLNVLYRDDSGTTWAGGRGNLGKVTDRHWESIELPREMKPLGIAAQTTGITIDASGTLLVSYLNPKSIFAYKDGQWSKPAWADKATFTTAMVKDEKGELWLGFLDSQLGRIQNGELKIFGKKEGLNIGNVISINPTGENEAWISGSKGVTLFKDGHFWPLTDESGNPYLVVVGTIKDSQGALWIDGLDGIRRIDAAALQQFLTDPSKSVRSELFDQSDGVEGTAGSGTSRPALRATRDGRLWFSRTDNLYWIDKAHQTPNSVPPQPHVTALKVDGQAVEPSNRLPPGTEQLEIDYTALGLAMPERAAFRYKLSGVDKVWQSVSTRRQAFYTNVSPGPHYFEVEASNEDGVWSPQPASVAFSIEPRFTQTRWFYGICALLVLLLLWIAHQARLRQVSRRLEMVAEAQSRERVRIARELHDTLLQSTEGLLMRMQGIAMSADSGSPIRTRIEDSLERAQAVITEGRDRVRNLRTSTGARGSPAEELSSVADQLSLQHANPASIVEFKTTITGAALPLTAAVFETALEVGREALRNAYAHADAAHVELTLEYGVDFFKLGIKDDGKGFDLEMLDAAVESGHWGVRGMRERAAEVSGTLEIKSRGDGTSVFLSVPSNRAYDVPTFRRVRWPWKRPGH